jgi:hypothetical protein
MKLQSNDLAEIAARTRVCPTSAEPPHADLLEIDRLAGCGRAISRKSTTFGCSSVAAVRSPAVR